MKKSAKERLLELADPAISALSKIVRDEDTDDSVRVRAALGILDRIGYGPGSKIELDVGLTKFEQTLVTAYGGEVVNGEAVFPKTPDRNGGVDRDSLADPPHALGLGVGAADHWEDREQAEYDLQTEIDRERYAEEGAQVERDRIRSTGPVVRGEVVDNDPPAYDPERGRWP
ncbi:MULTISPECIES: hypothetical protein [unclassified Nocardioides]|uniref:hypothetical protein n=1 Tax=unclassified Nocardioides TaxID=2615069 RepID=UPI0036172A71